MSRLPLLDGSPHSRPPEHGLISVSSAIPWSFIDEHASAWRGQSMSAFPLLKLWCDGNSAFERILQDGMNANCNTRRVWPSQDGGTNRFFDNSARDKDLDDMIAHCGERGARVEITAVTNWRTPDLDRPMAQRVLDIAANHWNAFVEYVNEPWNVGYNVLQLAAGTNPYWLLYAFGYDVTADPNAGWTTVARGRYLTVRTPRDQAHYPRNSKDLVEMRGLGRPVWDDEPLGVANFDREGTGARWSDLDAHVSHHAVAALFGAGSTIHSQNGLDGVPFDDRTAQIANVIGQVWDFIPPDVIGWSYSRNGLSDFPLVVNGADTYDGEGHAYAAIVGNSSLAYVVVPKPTAQWTPRLVNGWRIERVGPVPYVLCCTR